MDKENYYGKIWEYNVLWQCKDLGCYFRKLGLKSKANKQKPNHHEGRGSQQ